METVSFFSRRGHQLGFCAPIRLPEVIEMTDRALLHYRGDNISFAGEGEKNGKTVGRGKARKRGEKNEKWRKAKLL